MENKVIMEAKDEPEYRGIEAMPFVIGNETFEKLGTLGASSNLLVYLTSVFHMNTITATNIINIFNGTCNIGTLLGAFLCDAYFGRYKVLGFASISSTLGMLVLALTAAISKLHPSPCGSTQEDSECEGPTPWQMAFLLSSFAFLIVGASGIRPCNLAFGADQFNPNTESGKRGIRSFFNWRLDNYFFLANRYYFTYTFAMMVSFTVIVYLQSNVSWAIGLGVPSFLMFLSCVFFFIGSRIYVKVLPKGSPLTSVVQVMVVAYQKRKLKLPEQPLVTLHDHIPIDSLNSKLPYTDQFKFLHKAAIITTQDQLKPDGSATNAWRLCSIQQVEEVKCLLRMTPIWIFGIIYNLVPVQQQTYVVFQALQSDRRLGSTNFTIPAASYIIFTMLSISIWIPIYDRLIVPTIRKITKNPDGMTVLQKMGIGLVIAIITMVVSGFVERRRRTLALTRPTLGYEPRKGAISSMSAMWLVAQLSLTGLSEAFTVIGDIEFFYKQVPEDMRSIGGAILFCGFAISSYLSSFLISIVHRVTSGNGKVNWLDEDLNKGRLDYFYFLISGLEVLNLGYFLIITKWYVYKGTGGKNMLDVPKDDVDTEKTHALV